jgi:hypothetical protein
MYQCTDLCVMRSEKYNTGCKGHISMRYCSCCGVECKHLLFVCSALLAENHLQHCCRLFTSQKHPGAMHVRPQVSFGYWTLLLFGIADSVAGAAAMCMCHT